jgi:hypothetical protein
MDITTEELAVGPVAVADPSTSRQLVVGQVLLAGTPRLALAAERVVTRTWMAASTSWPPPPDGWVWWKETPRPLTRRVGLGALLVFGALVVAAVPGLLIAAEIYGSATGCGSVDPTDPQNYSRITILNDESTNIVIDDCQGGYCSVTKPARLNPGQRYRDDAACGMSGVNMTSWQIRSSDGTALGFIAVDTPRKNDGLTFRASSASRNRRTPTQAG